MAGTSSVSFDFHYNTATISPSEPISILVEFDKLILLPKFFP
jgi:hypothetical protein